MCLSLRLRGGGAGGRDGTGGGDEGSECGEGGKAAADEEEARRRRSHERIDRVENELSRKAREEGKYDDFFMDSDEWDDKTRRVMDALSDFDAPLYTLPKQKRLDLAADMADLIRCCSVPEWMVMRVSLLELKMSLLCVSLLAVTCL